jgi:hypothetical protein
MWKVQKRRCTSTKKSLRFEVEKQKKTWKSTVDSKQHFDGGTKPRSPPPPSRSTVGTIHHERCRDSSWAQTSRSTQHEWPSPQPTIDSPWHPESKNWKVNVKVTTLVSWSIYTNQESAEISALFSLRSMSVFYHPMDILHRLSHRLEEPCTRLRERSTRLEIFLTVWR